MDGKCKEDEDVKGYRKLTEDPVTIDDLAMDLENGDLENADEKMQGILSKISSHTEKTGIHEYRLVVYAKKQERKQGGS